MAPADPPPTDEEILAALTAFAAAKERDVVARALEAARDRLRMDAAYVSTITAAVQRVDQVAGDTRPLGFDVGTSLPLSETYCDQMLRGELPCLVPDTSTMPQIRDLDVTARVGAYVGVPIRLADGRLHGTICCASGRAHSAFDADELHFMQVLAQIVGAEIDRSEGDRAKAVAHVLRATEHPVGGD